MSGNWRPAIASRKLQDDLARHLDLAEEAANGGDGLSPSEVRSFVNILRAGLRLSKRFTLRAIPGRSDIRQLVRITPRRRGR